MGRYRPRSWLSGRRHLPALYPAVWRLQGGKREAHALLERGLGDALAVRRRTARLVGAEPEQAERRDHLLGGGSCARLRLLPPGFRLPPRRLALLLHELGPEGALGFILIVCPAAQPDPRHAGPAPAGHR